MTCTRQQCHSSPSHPPRLPHACSARPGLHTPVCPVCFTAAERGRRRRSPSETNSTSPTDPAAIRQGHRGRRPGRHRRSPGRRRTDRPRRRQARAAQPQPPAHRRPGGEAHPRPAHRADQERDAEDHADRRHPRPRRQGEAGRQGRRQGQRRHRCTPATSAPTPVCRSSAATSSCTPRPPPGLGHGEQHLQHQADHQGRLHHRDLHQVRRRDQGARRGQGAWTPRRPPPTAPAR